VTVPVGSGPYGAGYNGRNGYVYVANDGSTTVTVINGTTVVATVPVGSEPGGVAYDSGNGYVYVANSAWFSDTVSVINGTTVVATIPVGINPWDVAYNARNGYVYVANTGSNNVTVIDGTTVVGSVPVGGGPIAVGYNSGNGYVYVANQGSSDVTVINGTTVVGTVPVGSSPSDVEYDGGNGYVYVTNFYSNNLSVINGTTVVGTVPVGAYPLGSGYNSGNGYLYVANSGSNNLTVIDGTTVVGTVPVGGAPHSVVYHTGNGYVYVTNFGSDAVSVFSTMPPPLVTFTETGLPSGTSWSVTLANASNTSTTPLMTFSAPNGTYTYAVGRVPGYTASPSSESITVDGTPVHAVIAFSVTIYAVTFTESGLPPGTSWSVTLGVPTLSSTADNITFMEPDGTYPFSIGPAAGYAVSPSSGNVNVSGKAANQSVLFTAVFLGLPAAQGYTLLAGIVLALVAVGVLFALVRVRRKRRFPPNHP
jgi:YVTN family beta-propeller protein